MMRNWRPKEKDNRIISDSLKKEKGKGEKDLHHHHITQKYLISGIRLGQLETKILRELPNLSKQVKTREGSNSNSVSSMHFMEENMKIHDKKYLLEPDSRPKTPVIVVGYPNGYPRGLHILGNRSGSRNHHHHHHIKNESTLPNNSTVKDKSTKIPVEDRANVEECSITPGTLDMGTRSKSFSRFNHDSHSSHPTDIRANSILENSKTNKGGKTDNNIFNNPSISSVKSKKLLIHHNEKEKKSTRKTALDKRASKSLKGSTSKSVSGVPIAPWRDISQFQSKAEHRRQTFYNFKIMSPEPPKTPVTQICRARPSNNQSHNTHSLASRLKDTDSKFKSMNLFPGKTSSREQAFQASAMIASSITANKSSLLNKKRNSGGGVGKSMTGLSLSRPSPSRPLVKACRDPTKNKHPPNCHVSRGHSNNCNSITKSGSVTGVTSLTSKKSLVTVNDRGPSSGQNNLNTLSNRWTNIVQTNQIPIPPSKRLEQARMMNHIINGYSHNNEKYGVQETREKYSYPLQHSRHRQHPPLIKTSHVTSIPTTTTSTQQQHSHVQKSEKTPLLPPVSNTAGPKRENIYIGHYDGSDDSEDSGSRTEAEKPQTQNKHAEKPKAMESVPD